MKTKKRVEKKILKFEVVPGIAFATDITPELFEFNQCLPQFTGNDYTVCNELSQTCHDLKIFPKTNTLVISDQSFAKIVSTNQFSDDVARALNVNETSATKAIAEFFDDNTLLVQPTGVQGGLYWATNTIEMLGPAYMVVRTTIAAKVAGVSGATVITTQPLMLVAVPTIGAMFFCGCSTLFPNTTVGYLCDKVGYGLSRPMRLVELGYNAYIAPVINMTLGVPTVLNLTEQMLRGPGLNATEAATLLTASQKQSLFKVVRKQGWEMIKDLLKAGATI